MTRFVHLNGPSAVGKSTLARRYAEAHPGVLNLDIDQVVSLIGGWRDDFYGTLGPARELAISMAETHLRSGHDVVMPQLVTNVEQAGRFEAAAARAGAEYREVVLTVGKAEMATRFDGRVASGHHRDIDDLVVRQGGRVVLARIHDHLTAYLAERPEALLVPTDDLDADGTYEAFVAALA
ncbi:AAA family ATPase [Amycolatopsis albispora]|nr:AAA family ATPase [Amycolatopsis albispora]